MQNNATETTGGSSIRRSSGSGGSRPRKKKKNQLPIGFGVLTAMIIIGVLLGLKNGTLALYWGIWLLLRFYPAEVPFLFYRLVKGPLYNRIHIHHQGSAYCVCHYHHRLYSYQIRRLRQRAGNSRTKLHHANQPCHGSGRHHVRYRHGYCRRMCIRNPDACGRRFCHADVKPVIFCHRVPDWCKPHGMVDRKLHSSRP